MTEQEKVRLLMAPFWFVMGMIAGVLVLWMMVRPTLDLATDTVKRLSLEVQECTARPQGVDLFHGLLRVEPGPALAPPAAAASHQPLITDH